jgi:glycogen synthase
VRARMLRILKRHKIGMLHVQCASANAHYAMIAKRALGLPLLFTAQGERTMDAERVYEKSPFINRVLRRLLKEADYITACSRDTLEDLESFGGEAFGARASVVYNGIRVEDFEGARPYVHPRPYILGIGRMVHQKGFDVLIEAFAEAGIESHDLILAGDGPERASLEELARARKLGGRVHFLGRADRGTAVGLFSGCSFFVLPSRQEPMGIVNLEAMAAGKAVVASRTGGVKEIVEDGETGLLTTPGDARELAAALRRMAGEDLLRVRMGASGMRRVRNFTWESIARSYRQIYERIAAETSAPGAIAAAGMPLLNPE